MAKPKFSASKKFQGEYKTTLISFAKYHLIMFAIAKNMEMIKEEQNQISLILFFYKNIQKRAHSCGLFFVHSSKINLSI